MKLILCLKCHDVVKAGFLKVKKCECGKSSALYTDNLNAEYKGPCSPLGISNPSIADSVKNQPRSGMGKKFDAFVIAKKCDTFKKVKKFTKIKE